MTSYVYYTPLYRMLEAICLKKTAISCYDNSGEAMKKVVFGFVAACGTCKMSEYMLDVVAEAIDFPLEKINLNLNKPLIEHYQIISTPVFLLLDGEQEVDRFYAAKSVTFLYEKIQSFMEM